MERRNSKNILIFILTVISLISFSLFLGVFKTDKRNIVSAEEPTYITERCVLTGQTSSPVILTVSAEETVIILDNYLYNGEGPAFTISKAENLDFAFLTIVFNGESMITATNGSIFEFVSEDINCVWTSLTGGSVGMWTDGNYPILNSSSEYFSLDINSRLFQSAVVGENEYNKDAFNNVSSALRSPENNNASIYFSLSDIEVMELSNADSGKIFTSDNYNISEDYVSTSNYTSLKITASETFDITLSGYFFAGIETNECDAAITIYNENPDTELTVRIIINDYVSFSELEMPAIKLMSDNITCIFTTGTEESRFVIQNFGDQYLTTGELVYSTNGALYSATPSSTFIYDENVVIETMPPNGNIQPTNIISEAMGENGFFAFKITNGGNTHNHNYIEINREEATCQHEGYIYYQCTECGDTYTEVLPTVDHHYVETNRKEPTCTEYGYVSYECEYCGEGETEFLSSTGHDYHEEIVPATCSEEGYTEYYCTECGYSYKADYVPATGEHNYTGISYEWNEDYSACIAIAYCENCEERITEEATISYSDEQGGNEYTTTVSATFGNSIFGEQTQYIHNVILKKNNTDQPYLRYEGGVVKVYIEDGYNYDVGGSWTGGIVIFNTSKNDRLTVYFIFEGDATIISGENHPAIRIGDNDNGVDYTHNITCYISTNSTKSSSVKIATSGYECRPILVTDPQTSQLIIDDSVVIEGIYKLYDYEYGIEDGSLIDGGTEQAVTTILNDEACQAVIIKMFSERQIEPDEPTHEHNFVEMDREESTCVHEGHIEYICTICEETYIETLPLGEHDYHEEIVEPTNTEEGYTKHTCSVCGDTYYDKYVPAKREEIIEVIGDLIEYIEVEVPADATEEERIKAEEQQQKVEEALEVIKPETIEEIATKVNDAMDVLQEELNRQMEGKTEEEKAELIKEYEDNVEKVTIIFQNSLIVGAKMDSANEEAEEFSKTVPENIGIDMADILGDFYKRQYELLLNKNQSNSSVSGYAKTFDASSSTGLDLDTDKETYQNVVEFVDTSVSNMKNAVLLIRTCSGNAVKQSVNDYVNRVAYSSFKDFDKDAADMEFVQNAYMAIMLNLQEQVLSTLENEYQETKASGKYSGKALEDYEANYQEQVKNVSDFETFEIMILEVMRQKYVTILNNRLDNKLLTKEEYDVLFEGAKDVDAFETKYNEIFTNWALNKEDASGITLEEISNSVIGNTKKQMGAGEYMANGLSTLELIIFIVVFSTLFIGGTTMLTIKYLPKIKAKHREGK